MTRNRGPQPQLTKRSLTNGDRLPDHSAPREIHDRDTGPITIPPPMNSSADALRHTVAYMAEKFTAESEKNYATRESIREIRNMSDGVKDLARGIKESREATEKAELVASERHQSIGATLSVILSETRSNRADINTLQTENLSVQSRVSAIEKKAELEIAESAGADKMLARQKNIAKLLWSVVVTLFGIASYLAGKLIK